jgi:tRNA A37 threonylcarbamoyladenosine dehydratase
VDVTSVSSISESEYNSRFSGIKRLLGSAAQERLRKAHVAIIGIGGVGSWVVEALARTGLGALTLVDLDEVCLSNTNRQLPALTSEIGKSKVHVMRSRIAEINPECRVHAEEVFLTQTNADHLLSRGYSYIVDAIDTLENKAVLVDWCRRQHIPMLTVGGAGGRRDPTAIKLCDLAFSSNDRLLQKLRKLLRKDYNFPNGGRIPFGVPCVYSSEVPVFPQSDGTICERREDQAATRLNCESGFGTAAFVTGAFGFVAAAEVVRFLSEEPSK